MSYIDIAFALLSGILSILTAESILLLPLLFCAIGARVRPVTLAPALGISLVITGAAASALGQKLGLDASYVRYGACGILLLQGLLLISESLTERFSVLTGGTGGGFSDDADFPPGTFLRQFLLALFVGANWFPPIGPTLGKALLMAASGRNLSLALGACFAFGLGAAIPVIALGRIIRMLPGIGSGALTRGMMGNRLLALALFLVAMAGLSGFDLFLVQRIDAFLPLWAAKMAGMF